jgi:hypothetical protein
VYVCSEGTFIPEYTCVAKNVEVSCNSRIEGKNMIIIGGSDQDLTKFIKAEIYRIKKLSKLSPNLTTNFDALESMVISNPVI